MRNRPRADPQADGALALRARFQIVDHERRLFLTVDKETGTLAAHVNLDPGPDVRLEVDVRFVLGRGLLAEPRPRPIGMRDVYCTA